MVTISSMTAVTKVISVASLSFEGHLIEVGSDTTKGLPSLHIHTPHHAASRDAPIGGGNSPKPRDISLAHFRGALP